jgi:hypothetical protein
LVCVELEFNIRSSILGFDFLFDMLGQYSVGGGRETAPLCPSLLYFVSQQYQLSVNYIYLTYICKIHTVIYACVRVCEIYIYKKSQLNNCVCSQTVASMSKLGPSKCPVAHGDNTQAPPTPQQPQQHNEVPDTPDRPIMFGGHSSAAFSKAGGCPVNHGKGSAAATTTAAAAAAAPAGPMDEVPDVRIPSSGRGNSDDGKAWVNPSANQLYRALKRKQKPIQRGDALGVAEVHTMVTTESWKCVMEYEALHPEYVHCTFMNERTN